MRSLRVDKIQFTAQFLLATLAVIIAASVLYLSQMYHTVIKLYSKHVAKENTCLDKNAIF